jgi:alpha/beta hydrolase fold
VLRDEGEAYGRKLTAAGVRTTSVRDNGAIHDFMMLNPVRETAATTAVELRVTTGKEHPMKVTRVYTGTDGRSHFEDLEIPQWPSTNGSLSEQLPTTGSTFGTIPGGFFQDFHPAPRRQFVIPLGGVAEIETAEGTVTRLATGDVLLADDTTGQGHIFREVEGPLTLLILPLPPEVDLATWHTPA